MKKFYAAILMLALVSLLSGFIQAKSDVQRCTYYDQLENAPPGNVPAINVSNEVTVPSMTMICTLRPGVQHQFSSVNDDNSIVIHNEMIKTGDIYKVKNRIGHSNKYCRYDKSLVECKYSIQGYRLPRDGLKQSWQA